MILVKLQGGLGNQMFQYALGRSLSLKKGTNLFFDTTSFLKDSLRTYSLNVFNITENIASETDIKKYQKYKRKTGHFRYFWNIFIANWKKYTVEKQFHFDPDIFNISNDAYIEGYWNTEKYFKDIRSTLLTDFELKNKISGKNKEVAEQISKTDAVSVHVRRGDYANNPSTNYVWGTLEKEYYTKALSIIKSKVKDPRFFVFSDDISWVKGNLHFPQDTIYIDWNKNCPEEDIRLMSLCKNHVIANSTFSWWGAWLSQNQNKIVVGPEKWFNRSKPNVKTVDVLPAGWIKI